MKPKKYLTALFYSVQTPFGVWAGIEFSENNMIIAWVLIAVMMILEAIAVFFWMDAQSEQTVNDLVKKQNGKNEYRPNQPNKSFDTDY